MVRLTDRPDMTLDVYRGRKTTIQYNNSDGPNIKLVDLFKLVGTGSCLVIRGSTGGFLLLQYFSGVVLHPRVLQVSQYASVESSSLTYPRPYS